MKPIFDNLKAAYNAKKNTSGKWRTTLVVHGPLSTSSLLQKTGFMSLARLLSPLLALGGLRLCYHSTSDNLC